MPELDQQGRLNTLYAERYEIRSVIGAGGMGSIYEAKHKFTGQIVALKVLHPKFADTEELAERFLREARAPREVQHPGLVPIFDAGRDADGSLYLAMEKLHGETLKQALIKKRIDYRTLVKHMVEVLDALHAAHAAGFVHRDIKPGNIFLSREEKDVDRARLLDFGVTRVMHGHKPVTAPGRTVGTPYFMAPEQALGGLVDARSDLWSVGAVLYTGLCGHPPFANADLAVAVQELVTTSPLGVRSVNPKVPKPLAEVIDRSLMKNPNDRWNSAGAMANALRGCIGDKRIASWEATISNVELPSDQRMSVPGGVVTPLARSSDRATKEVRVVRPDKGKSTKAKANKVPWAIIALAVVFAVVGLTVAVIGAVVFFGSAADEANGAGIPAAPSIGVPQPVDPGAMQPGGEVLPTATETDGPPMQPAAPR